jgi:hypothetical protein
MSLIQFGHLALEQVIACFMKPRLVQGNGADRR